MSFSLVVTSRHSLSHLSHLVAALTEVTMLQYIYVEDVSITRVKTLAYSLRAARMSSDMLFLLVWSMQPRSNLLSLPVLSIPVDLQQLQG